MIRIEIEKNKWEGIKKEHKKWCKEYFEYLAWDDLLKDLMTKEIIKEKCKFDDKIINEEIPERLSNFILKFRGDFFLSEEVEDEFKKYFTNNYKNMEFIKMIKSHFVETQQVKDYGKKHWHKYWELCKTDEERQFYIFLFTGENKIDFTRKFEEIKCDLLKEIDKGIIKKSKEESEKFLERLLTKSNTYTLIIRCILGLPEKDNTNLKKNLDKIFNYSKFQTEKRHEILSLMGFEVCPYCQRNYIANFNVNKTTADLDHFYPQAQYPYLALSLYNFIPSCHTCNSTMKNQAEIGINTHIYPYTESMEEDIKFTIETDSFMDNIFTKNQNLNIDIDVISKDIEKNKKIENSLKTFKLREVYKNSHSKYVGDLIHNFQKYPKSYTKALGEIFLDEENKYSKGHQEKLQILNDNFQEIIKKPYIDKIEKGEPLGKLTKDIMEELGIK